MLLCVADVDNVITATQFFLGLQSFLACESTLLFQRILTGVGCNKDLYPWM